MDWSLIMGRGGGGHKTGEGGGQWVASEVLPQRKGGGGVGKRFSHAEEESTTRFWVVFTM